MGILGRLGGGDDGSLATGLPASPATLNLTDLELMVQWCNSTHQALARNETVGYIWRCLVPEEALSHPFLMHGILALSALHLARIRDDHHRPAYKSLAVAHQNQALTLFRELLDDINDSNAKAMFSFASVVALYAFGFPHEPDLNDPWTNIDDLHQVLVLIRGVQQVVNRASTPLRHSDFSLLLQLDDHEPLLSDDARLALEELLEVNSVCGAQDETHDTEIYEAVIQNLMETLSKIHQDSSLTSVGRWAIRLKPRYVDLVQEHAPLALVILAYYCVILHYQRHHWCIDNWSFRVSRAIWLVLDDQWRPLTRWPMVQIFGQNFLDEENTAID